MEGCDKTNTIDLEEVRLREEYEHLTAKLHKQKLILSVLKDIDCNEVQNVDEIGKQNIDKALDFVRAFDYLKMDHAGTNVLGIPDKPHELSYVEKRALKAKVLENLPKYYEKPLEFCRNLEPEILNPEILDKQLVDLKAREQELVAELAAKNAELCETLNEAVELRFGPTQEDSSKMIKSKIEVEQVKAQLIKTLLAENVSSMSEHVDKAMDKIEYYLDVAIADKQQAIATDKSDSK